MRLARILCVSICQCGHVYVGLTILFLAGPALLDESKVDLISVLKITCHEMVIYLSQRVSSMPCFCFSALFH